MDWINWATKAGQWRRPWSGKGDGVEALAAALHAAARDGHLDLVRRLIGQGARGDHQGWGGRDALIASIMERRPDAEAMASLLMPVSDPNKRDGGGRCALMSSLGDPSTSRTRPLDDWGKPKDWAKVFWMILPWADLSGGQGWRALDLAAKVGWSEAAGAIAARLSWPKAGGGDLPEASDALASVAIHSPELALSWACAESVDEASWVLAALKLDRMNVVAKGEHAKRCGAGQSTVRLALEKIHLSKSTEMSAKAGTPSRL